MSDWNNFSAIDIISHAFKNKVSCFSYYIKNNLLHSGYRNLLPKNETETGRLLFICVEVSFSKLENETFILTVSLDLRHYG